MNIPEYTIPDLPTPVRQGDIFQWTKRHEPWRCFGVVVTADCDVAHDKHRGVLSYCPVLTLKQTMALFWLPDVLRSYYQRHLSDILDTIHELQRQYAPEFSTPLDAALLPGWLTRRGPTGIAEDLRVPTGSSYDSLTARLKLLDHLTRPIETMTLEEQIRHVAIAKLATLAPATDELSSAKVKVWNELSSRVHTLAGDMFFINCIAKEHSAGYIVYLRRIGEIPDSAIATIPSDERRTEDIKAIRIAQLAPPFRYCLTQRLAAVFSSIGLPDSHATQARETVAALGANLGCARKN